MHQFDILAVLVGLFHIIRCKTCIPPEYIRNDRVRFGPKHVYVGAGDQAIVQCVIQYAADEDPPQTYVYADDCKVVGYDDPAWVTSITESDSPCTHQEDSTLCRRVTMYISGVKEAHGRRLYCCARLGQRSCSLNSTISLVEAVEPAILVKDHNRGGLIQPTKVPTGAEKTSYYLLPSNAPRMSAEVFPDPDLSSLHISGGTRTDIYSLVVLLVPNLLSITFMFELFCVHCIV